MTIEPNMEVEAFDSDGCENMCWAGGVNESGKAFTDPLREQIVHLYTQGFQTSQISRDFKITDRKVSNILSHFRSYGTVLPFVTDGSQSSLQCYA